MRLAVALVLASACQGPAADDTGDQGEPEVSVLHPEKAPLPGESECTVTITTNLADEGHDHVPVCTPVDYATNPPSSGDHWPIWAAYQTFDAPVPREMLVHDLEHGAIVMTYACDPDCPDVISAFEAVRDEFPPDPVCSGGPARLVIAPDPLLDEPIAMAAWHATYVATCLDPDSLAAFASDHYDHGGEQMCGEGVDPADPLTGVPDCPE